MNGDHASTDDDGDGVGDETAKIAAAAAVTAVDAESNRLFIVPVDLLINNENVCTASYGTCSSCLFGCYLFDVNVLMMMC